MQRTVKVLGAITLGLALGSAGAQTFPNKPVRVVVGFSSGSNDSTARLVSSELGKRLGQQVIVESVVGANGTIGAHQAAKAAPDGYTLFFGAASGIAPIFQKNGVFLGKAFLPVSRVMYQPFIWYVSGTLPVRNLQELVAYSKANPGKLNFGGPGASLPMLAALLKARTGVDYVNVPYKSTGQVVAAMLTGEVAFTTNFVVGFAEHIQSGKIRPLFVMAPQRFPLMPSAPSSTEVGYPDLVASANYGLWAPLGTPAAIVNRLSADVAATVRDAELAKRMRDGLGGEPDGSTPAEQLRIYDEEIKFWADLAKALNYEPE
jgi:tripartite-type tricarboxylate transporter receptor subunit TctC